MIKELENLIGKDYKNLNSKEFSDLIISFLKSGKIKKEVVVSDRGDGRSGRIDLVYLKDGKEIAIELDRLKPRYKSIFKLKNYGADKSFVITRSPVKIHTI